MAEVDASIYNAFGSKRKSPEDFLAERQALEGNALGIQSARTKMAQEQESLQRQGQLRNLLAGGADANALMRGGFLDEGMKLNKNTADAGLAAAQTKKYDADTFKTNAEAIGIKAKQFYDQIGRLSSPQQAQALLSAAFNDEHLGPIIQASGKSLQQGLAEVPTDPLKFRQWQMLTADGISKLEKHALDVRQQAEVERNNSTQNAISRGNLAVSQGNLGLSRQRLEFDRSKEASDATLGVTYQQDSQGNLVALPKQARPGAPIAPIPVMAGGTQVQGKGSPKAAFTQQYGMVKSALDDVAKLLPKATSSGAGAAVDATLGFVGASTEGADAAAKLDTLGGWLTTSVPRFEGPQSDKDVMTYQRMAGDVANRRLPTSQRIEAAKSLGKLMDDRAKAYGISAAGAPDESRGGGPKPGAVESGYRFKGGNPSDKANWEKVK